MVKKCLYIKKDFKRLSNKEYGAGIVGQEQSRNLEVHTASRSICTASYLL